ncbi:MAG: DUF255 domain-containing protein, partial [Bacteroidota bacterium]
MKLVVSSIILIIFLSACSTRDKVPTEIKWQYSLSKATFEQAEKEGKLILLTLEANWCHWCHVMEDSTYSNANVRNLLDEEFICVKVDQDANPELASRYRKYGWPATIVLNAKGEDVLKKAGYMNPTKYMQALEDAIDGKAQVEKPEVAEKARPLDEFKNRLDNNFDKFLDFNEGGFKSAMKYLEEESMDFALYFSKTEVDKKWFQKSVKAAYSLCDSEWGGVYQYSTQRDWKHPHYEKLLHIQARYLRLFMDDYAFYGNESSLKKATSIKAYCDRFLKQKNGLYGNAQDADLRKGEKASAYFQLSDQERMKLGVPAVDTNTYTNSNADYARAILKYYSMLPNEADSVTYFTIVNKLAQRKAKNGLYSHTEKAKKIDALRDNLAMVQLFAEHIKRFPRDEKIKMEMKDLMKSIKTHFELANGTFQGFSGDLGLAPEANIEENVPLARVFNWYAAYSGKKEYKKRAQAIVSYLCRMDSGKKFYHEPGISMLLEEIKTEAQSIVSVKEGKTHPLLEKAYVFAPFYSCFYVLEDNPNSSKNEQFSGITYSSLFICTSTFCS